MTTVPTGLVDYLGRPIQVGQLTKELAAPQLGSVRHWFYDSIAFGLTPERLAQILIGVDQNQDVVEYLTLAEEMEERDLHYASVLRTRKLAVSALTIRVESPDDKDQEATDFVNGILKRKQVKQLLAEQLDAIGKGYSVNEIMWDTSEKQWEPRAYEWRDPRHFQFDRITGRELRLRDPADYAYGVELAPYKFIQHRPHLKTGLPIRGGLARLACVAFMCKNFTLKDWMSFCEVFGMPLRLGKYGSSATPEQKAALLAAVTQIGTDAAAIIPDSMVIDFMATNPGAGGDKLFMGLSDWLDSQVSKGVLGQTMTTDNGSSLSQAQVHNDVREDIRNDDAMKLAATLERDLVKPLIDLNFGPRKAGEYPQVCLEEEETEDLKLLSDSLTPFIDRGLPVEISTILDKFGLEVPKGVEAGALLQAKGPAAPTGGQHGDTTAGPQIPEPPPEPTAPPPGKPPKPGQPSAKQLARVVMSAVRQALAGFNPDQPRQPDGKFGLGGGDVAEKPAPKEGGTKELVPVGEGKVGGDGQLNWKTMSTAQKNVLGDAVEEYSDTIDDEDASVLVQEAYDAVKAGDELDDDQKLVLLDALDQHSGTLSGQGDEEGMGHVEDMKFALGDPSQPSPAPAGQGGKYSQLDAEAQHLVDVAFEQAAAQAQEDGEQGSVDYLNAVHAKLIKGEVLDEGEAQLAQQVLADHANLVGNNGHGSVAQQVKDAAAHLAGTKPAAHAPAALETTGPAAPAGTWATLGGDQQAVVDAALDMAVNGLDADYAPTMEDAVGKLKAGLALTPAEHDAVRQGLTDYYDASKDNDPEDELGNAAAVTEALSKLDSAADKASKPPKVEPPKPPIMDWTPGDQGEEALQKEASWSPPANPNFGSGKAADFRKEVFAQHAEMSKGEGVSYKSDKAIAKELAAKHGMDEKKALSYVKWYRNDMRKSGLLPPKPGMIVKPQATKPLDEGKVGKPHGDIVKPAPKPVAKEFADVPVTEAQATSADIANWHKSMTASEKSAWSSWKGNGYIEIRKAQEDPKYLAARPELKKKIENLEKAVEKAPPFQGPLFRGMKNLSAAEVKQLTQVGAVHEQPAFASWSPEPKVAHGFFHGSDKTYGVMFRLPWNSGIAKAVDLGGESEALIGKGAQFKVARVAKLVNNGAWNNKFVVDLEEI